MKDEFISLNMEGKYFLYGLQSGIFAETDPLINNIVDYLQEGLTKEVIIDRLKKEYEIEKIEKCFEIINLIRNKNRAILKSDEEGRAGNLWLNVIHDCNMNCVYCFADAGLYNSNRKVMSKETAKMCIDYWFDNKVDLAKYNIYFFGGEPFMNSEVISYSIDYINSLFKDSNKEIRYNITTNGTIYNEEFLKKLSENSTEFTVSLDGFEELQNSQRPFKNKNMDTYNVVVENFKKFKKYLKNIKANMVVTKKGVPYLKEAVEHLWDLGFVSVTSFLVVSNDEKVQINTSDLEIIYPQIEELNRKTIENIINRVPRKFSNSLPFSRRIHKGSFSIGCSFQCSNSIVFSPEGDIFNCYELMGQDKYKLSNVKNNEKWTDICRCFPKKVEDRPCKKCWAVNLCGGGCSYDNYIYNGDINEPSKITCEFTKFLIKQAIEMYGLLYINLPDYLNYIFGGKN